MGVKDMSIDTESIERAISRSTGTQYESMQYGPELPPSLRSFTSKGSGRGHTYLHNVGNDPLSSIAGPLKKSRFENHTIMVAAIVDALTTTAGQQALEWLDNNPTSGDGIWLHGTTGIALSGAWYGYEANSTAKKKIASIALNMRAYGDALFITSAYPDLFQAAAAP